MDFSEAKQRIIKHGIEDILMDKDKTSMNFILKNGEVINLYTTEEDVQYARENGWAFVQSEFMFIEGDLS